MYCVNCGVKLADTEKRCPLCETEVFHPEIPRKDGEPLYPRNAQPQEKPEGKWGRMIFTLAFLLPVILVLLADWQFNSAVTWSGFVVGALGMVYVMAVLPGWFRKPNPVVFVPCAFAALAVYLLYIDLVTPGSWFLSFALPVTGGVCLIVTAMVALLRYIRGGRLYIYGGGALAMGALMLLVEFLVNLTFGFTRFVGWSLYPLTVLVLLGGTLIFLAICRPAREAMERKFFI